MQHLAFATADIFATAAALADRGFEALAMSPNYYADLAARYDLPDGMVERLEAASILYDEDATGAFFQLYSRPLQNGMFIEIVERRGWLSAQAYGDLVALCQFLPGPASSQVGMGIGLMRAGHLGALAAWIGFTMPSAIVLILAALGLTQWGGMPHGLIQGLKLAAVAVVAHAVWGMAQTFCKGLPERLLMLLIKPAAQSHQNHQYKDCNLFPLPHILSTPFHIHTASTS